MKFFDRKQEIEHLQKIRQMAQNTAQILLLSKSITFYEVKRQKEEISIPILTEKAQHFFEATCRCKDYQVEYRGVSIEDM